MRWRAAFVWFGLVIPAGGCARDNPLFGLGLRGTEGGSMDGDGDVDGDGGVVTSGDDQPNGEGGGTAGSGDDGTTGPDAVSTGDPDGATTGQPGGTTIGETDAQGSASTTGTDPKDLVLFRGPDVLGDFGSGAAPDDTYGQAVDACLAHVAEVGMPCDGGAVVFALLRAEPTLVIEVDAFPGAIVDRAVVGPFGDLIAESAQQLFDGMLTASLQDAEVLSEPFWTGGYNNENGPNADCADWHAVNGFGWTGDPTLTNALWFEAQDLDCAELRPIVCGCAE